VISPRPAALAACLALVLIPACNSGPEMAGVTGTVTYHGKPLEKGNISFVATDGKRPNATAVIQPDGSYKLTTLESGDGVQLGDYKVTVTGTAKSEILDYIPKGKAKADADAKAKAGIPAKYQDPETSGLTATVKSGRNSFPFNIE
jgi:hypothetical protein